MTETHTAEGINRNVALYKLIDQININNDLSETKIESVEFVEKDGDRYKFEVTFE